MRFETVSLRNNLSKKKRLEVVTNIINRSSSDIILFGGHTVLDMADCNELVDRIESKETSVVFEVKKSGGKLFYQIEELPLSNRKCMFGEHVYKSNVLDI